MNKLSRFELNIDWKDRAESLRKRLELLLKAAKKVDRIWQGNVDDEFDKLHETIKRVEE